jgi:hypothetical protein
MGALDAPIGALSKTLIEKFGGDVVLRQVRKTAEYDTSTGTQATHARDRIIKAVREQYKARFGSSKNAGATAGDLQLTIAATGLNDEPLYGPPTEADTIVIGYRNFGSRSKPKIKGGEEYRILDIDEVMSGDAIALYVLHVRR